MNALAVNESVLLITGKDEETEGKFANASPVAQFTVSTPEHSGTKKVKRECSY